MVSLITISILMINEGIISNLLSRQDLIWLTTIYLVEHNNRWLDPWSFQVELLLQL